jgi:hypothetical protein
LAAAEKFRVSFGCVFELPFLRNAQKRGKKNPSKTTEGEKKTEEKNPHIFVMSPNV